jgi:hypothetical protein
LSRPSGQHLIVGLGPGRLVRLSSPRGVATVLVWRGCPRSIPSRDTARGNRGRFGRDTPGRRGLIWCEFLAGRATPFRASCGRAPTRGAGPRIHGPIRVGLAGRDLEVPVAARIEQPDRRSVGLPSSASGRWGLGRRSGRRRLPALRVRLPLTQHVPDDGRQLAHHRDAGHRRSPPALDPPEPVPQPSVPAEHLMHQLGEQPPGRGAARLGDPAQPLVTLRKPAVPVRLGGSVRSVAADQPVATPPAQLGSPTRPPIS